MHRPRFPDIQRRMPGRAGGVEPIKGLAGAPVRDHDDSLHQRSEHVVAGHARRPPGIIQRDAAQMGIDPGAAVRRQRQQRPVRAPVVVVRNRSRVRDQDVPDRLVVEQELDQGGLEIVRRVGHGDEAVVETEQDEAVFERRLERAGEVGEVQGGGVAGPLLALGGAGRVPARPGDAVHVRDREPVDVQRVQSP